MIENANPSPLPFTATDQSPLILALDQSQTRLLLLNADRPWTDPEAIVWEWRADTDPTAIAAEERAKLASPNADRVPFFINPSDAKPMRNGTQILASMSGGAALLIDVASRRIVWLGDAGDNPHSIAELPHDCISTISSTGNQLRLFQLNAEEPGQAVAEYSLFGGHGLHWDEKRQCLWALGREEMQCYQLHLNNGQASLQLSWSAHLADIDVAQTQPPFHSGHDLSPAETPDVFYLTDSRRIWRFDAEGRTLCPASGLPVLDEIKSVSRHPGTGQVILLQPTETDSWWSDTLRDADGTWTRTLPGARFYKARWWID